MTFARRAAGLSTAMPTSHVPSEIGNEIIALDSGFASADVLPDLTRFAAEALTRHRNESLQYAAGQGQRQLRTWIAHYMNADGCNVSPDNILIVNGAKNGIDLICRLLLDEGDAMVVSAPTYFTAVPIFRSFGVELIEVSQDGEGLCVGELEDFHNPTGLTLSRARREALIELATREDIYLIEDNPYRRVRFEGESLPTLKALDRAGMVFHVGTFSRLIAPGVRIGWIAARKEMIARLIQLNADGGTNPLMQRIVHGFCSSPEFEEHIRKVQTTYREHRDRMVEAVRRELPGVSFVLPQGGYYLWLTLPAHVDGELLARQAEEAGVHIIPGTRFFASAGTGAAGDRARGRNHVRLSYSYATLTQIDEGIRRLARVYQSQMAA